MLCVPALLDTEGFLRLKKNESCAEVNIGKYGKALVIAYDLLALHTLTRCPLPSITRVLLKSVLTPRLAEILSLHFLSTECAAELSTTAFVIDCLCFALLQAEVALCFVSEQHNFAKVSCRQLNAIPLGFAVGVFCKTPPMRLLGTTYAGVTASLYLSAVSSL